MTDENKTASDYSFTDKDDFGREDIANKVIALLSADIDISPMIIDGSWGCGKSTFCKKLKLEIEENHNDKIIVGYIDSFKADHADNPIMSLIAMIDSLFIKEDSEIKENSTYTNFKKKAFSYLRFGGKTVLKAGCNWIIKESLNDLKDDFKEANLEGIEQAIAETSTTIVNHAFDTELKDHAQIEETLSSIKTTLTELANDKTFVIIIDELDRCRPTFAVTMLEAIKHVFDVPNIKFLLVTNKTQLIASVQHCYGEKVDADKYLDKFIKFSFKLSPHTGSMNRGIASYAAAKHLATLCSAKMTPSPQRNLIEFYQELIKFQELSLREVETYVRHLQILQILSTEDTEHNETKLHIQAIATYLFCFEASVAQDIVDKKKTCAASLQSFQLELSPDGNNSHTLWQYSSIINNIIELLNTKELSYITDLFIHHIKTLNLYHTS